jgi:hypothetical protein
MNNPENRSAQKAQAYNGALSADLVDSLVSVIKEVSSRLLLAKGEEATRECGAWL